ncbi:MULTISPECIES: amidohydrolase family protein [unclassified Paenibacillus]|uniref:amidohydrolase family protein n=1 Tax=unclassified Paenibacillus TaxID=185978 RepID=UPI001AEA717C|nr:MULTISPECIES: amidohydrolase family protein [unclassified Paenibacillus]MBP1154471.1 aminocarboxymuconate-semialdehyde decarboxylase [Paenibacillus sp. PvP091]MBP1170145.1 aminocarboxymuconate-semialdehyde decarboxylase [Paenibacillus sp. PvR098]MBP2441173.1 aminocarboxymuconate-semialdehyde decarboxylase [Paenibacillus sp. PvP052]
MVTDIHAHYVTPRALKVIREHPAPYGAKLQVNKEGKEFIEFAYGEIIRPFFPSIIDLEDREQRMLRQGVGHEVLSTWPDLFGYELPSEQGAKWSRLLNEALAEDLKEKNGLFSGMATVPLQDGELAARELEYAVSNLGFRSVMIASNIAGKELDDPSFDPFWEEAVRLHVPVLVHPLHVAGEERVRRFYMRAAIGYPYDTTIAGGYLILGGVFDRFPDLKVILLHAGGYLPYQIGRLQHTYEAHEESRSIAKKGPLEYFQLLYFDTITHFSPALSYLAEIAGADHLLLGTDQPFSMGDPDPCGKIRTAGLSEQDIRKIESINAKNLFHM